MEAVHCSAATLLFKPRLPSFTCLERCRRYDIVTPLRVEIHIPYCSDVERASELKDFLFTFNNACLTEAKNVE